MKNNEKGLKMRCYYVNEILDESTWNRKVVGLFTKCKTSAKDYSYDRFHNTRLLAKYETHEAGALEKVPYDNFTECNIKYRKVQVGSLFWTRCIFAQNDTEAREKFKKQDWSEEGFSTLNTWEKLLLPFANLLLEISNLQYVMRNKRK